MSELFTGSTSLKFVNALNKPPWKLYRLVINDSALSNHIELATQLWRKSVPPILSTRYCEFNGARSCAHTRKTFPVAPIHLFTKQIASTFNVSKIVDQKSFDIHDTSFPHAPYKLLPSIKNILGAHASFFSCFIFIAHFFVGLQELE